MHLGGTNRKRFQAFLDECAENMAGKERFLFLTVHQFMVGPKVLLKKSRQGFSLILSKDSLYLNIVEHAISALKAAINNEISRPKMQFKLNNNIMARQERIPLKAHKRRVLLAAAERNIYTIAIRKCNQCFRRMQTFLPRCLNGQFVAG